jgi:hypothetical protein
MRPHTPPVRRRWPTIFLALAVGFLLGITSIYLLKSPAAAISSKLLEWPFLTFLLIACLVLLFFDSLETLIARGEFTIAWGKDHSIKIRDLSSALDRELDPIRDDIEDLKSQIHSPRAYRDPWVRTTAYAAASPYETPGIDVIDVEDLEVPEFLRRGGRTARPDRPARHSPSIPPAQPDAATSARNAADPGVVPIEAPLAQEPVAVTFDPTTSRIQRLRDALTNHEFKWRSIDRLAAIIGTSEEETIKLVLTQPDIRLSMGKSGRQIAGLTSRVG